MCLAGHKVPELENSINRYVRRAELATGSVSLFSCVFGIVATKTSKLEVRN